MSKWIAVSERLPKLQSIIACDAYNNKPWIPGATLVIELENGKKKLYDATDYNGDIKAFLKGKKITSVSGKTYYIQPREIIAWMPLPKPYEPQEGSDKE